MCKVYIYHAFFKVYVHVQSVWYSLVHFMCSPTLHYLAMWVNTPTIFCGAPDQRCNIRLLFLHSSGHLEILVELYYGPTHRNLFHFGPIHKKHCSSRHHSLKTLALCTRSTTYPCIFQWQHRHYSLFTPASVSSYYLSFLPRRPKDSVGPCLRLI